jgi:hypothetical protein
MPKVKTVDTIARAVKPGPRPSGPETGSLVVPIWRQIDEALQNEAKTIFERFLEFAKLVEQAYDEQIWTHFGFQDPGPYFVTRIGIMPRTFRRYRRIQRLVAELGPEERDSAMEKLAALGSHKAELVAVACEKDPERFYDWVCEAESLTLEALKEKVDQTLGLPARGGATDGGEPGERFGRYLMNIVAADRRDQVEWVLNTIQTVGGYRNYVTAFLDLVDIGERDLGDAGHTREK